MRRSLLLIAAALWAGAVTIGHAHHPLANYDLDREVTISGEIVRATYAEPHSFLHVRDLRASDKDAVWIVELRGAAIVRANKVPEALPPGERVTLTGNPGRVAADRRLRLRLVTRVRDGWTWSNP
jgi:hypothetical protein